MRFMSRFGWCRNPHDRACNPDRAQLFRMKPVFRHVTESAIGPNPPGGRDRPTGFFHNLAMQSKNRRFARIYSTARKLEFRRRPILMGQQHPPLTQQDCIGSRTASILPSRQRTLAELRNHRLLLCKNTCKMLTGNGACNLKAHGVPSTLSSTFFADNLIRPAQYLRAADRHHP